MATNENVRDAFRRWGYLQAELDSLGRLRPMAHPDLDDARGEDAVRFRRVYCGSIGVEFMHLPQVERVRWVQERMEADAPAPVAADRARILRRIAEAELFERFLHARYIGTKRYSLEGAAAVVPLLDAILDEGSRRGTETALLGMSHRGRLAVMATIVGTPTAHLVAGFEDVDPRSLLGGGDVKYHLGATGDHKTASGGTVHIHLVSNPSHLEAVDPVLVGRARARQTRLGAEGRRQVLPIAVHGDAAFAGQGIVAETLNLSELEGFDVGGTLHVVINNLIGFTTSPAALHSSRFATDVAKRLAIPILHVNGEDPDAVVRAGHLAVAYRDTFGTDFVLDLIGYRRYGHSEVEDPTTTQPLLYGAIERRPLLMELYAERIGAGTGALDALRAELQEEFNQAQDAGRALTERPRLRNLPAYWASFRGGRYEASLEVDTAVTEEHIAEVARALATVPDGFHTHPKVRRLLDLRLEMGLGNQPVDWAAAETLAFATLATGGSNGSDARQRAVPVRLAGQDTRRGTFNQRHAVLVDVETGSEHVPLAHLAPHQAWVEIHDTALSEAAPLGFEYGFSRDYPEALVCWEAQFGDFVNGAQIIVDQFLCAGEDKWGLCSGLTILLPHGYEGQGPEHSSARFERFLQLAAEDNIQVCQPTTAGQYFHLLRRQVLRPWRKPLVVLTPKSLLRAPAAASPREALTRGRFEPVLGDPSVDGAARVLLVSGKLAVELETERARRGLGDTAIVRLEQIYPFPERELREVLARHPGARRVTWVQEEPANMGAFAFVMPRLQRLLGEGRVTSVKRSESASPATGSAKAHAIEERAILDLAFATFG